MLTENENVFREVNIENINYDMCNHAERTAIKSAIADEVQSFDCLAISTESEDGAPPCGTCRQYLAEFCDDRFTVYSDTGVEGYEEYTLGEIFPFLFRPKGRRGDRFMILTSYSSTEIAGRVLRNRNSWE